MEYNYKYNYLYKITNNLNQKFYIGIHSTNNLNDNYFGSGKNIRRAIAKYGKDNFTKEILKFRNTRSEIKQLEKSIVNEELLKNPLCYNIQVGGEGGTSIEMSKHHSIVLKGRKQTEETKAKISKAMKGRVSPNKGKVSPFKGKHLTDEAKRKISEAHKGKKLSNETKLKISLSTSGINNGFYGKHHSDEIKKKISESHKNIKTNN